MSASPELDPMYMAACQYGMRGLRVFPTESHGHKPIVSEWQRKASNDINWVDGCFQDRDVNLALCCGPQLNPKWQGALLCVDIDPQNGGKETWDALMAEFGWDLSDVPVHLTPSGGRHLYFLVPDELCVTGTDVLGRGIDTRGGHEGNVGCGYTMLPPSIRPSKTTGELVSYGERPERGLLHIDPPQAPETLLELLRAHLNPPKPERSAVQESINRHPSQVSRDNPWDWTRDNVRYEDKLVEHGWQQKGNMWSRPGKTPREGTGAYLHDDGRFTFWTQTDLPPSMMALGHRNVDGSYSISLADFITAYEFDGDRQRFGREYREKMPPSPQRVLPTAEAVLDDTPDEEAVRSPSTWGTIFDVQAAIDGRIVAPQPTVMARADGVCLFYPGEINSIFGAPGKGKGWVCLAAAVEQINLGHDIVYVDIEDTLASIITRLRVLGVDDKLIAKHLIYIKPSEPSILGMERPVDDLLAVCAERQPTLVIIDSLGQAFGLDGVEENSDTETNAWFMNVAVRLAAMGVCVLTVDHGTKSQEYRLFPSGTKRKVAIPSAVYLVEPLRELVKGKGGAVKLITAKDRHGNHQTNRPAGIMTFTAYGEQLRPTLVPVTDEQFQPESAVESQTRQVTERQLEVLGMARQLERDTGAPWSRARLASYAGGRATTTKEAINRLIEHGHFVEAGTYKNAPLYLVSELAPSTRYD